MRPRVFLDIEIGGRAIGRLVIELRSDVVPRTCENFRSHCLGDKGLTFVNRLFHRVIPGFMAQGGCDKGDGTGGSSIYGRSFNDENFRLRHDARGTLSMANSGAHTNGSQFFITFKATPHLDGKHVVFARVVDGLDVLAIIEKVATGPLDRPRMPVTIARCGEMLEEETPTQAPTKVIRSSGATSADETAQAREQGADDRMKEEEREEEDVSSDAVAVVDVESATKGMSAMEKRLFIIRMKLNAGRRANRKAAEEEFRKVYKQREKGPGSSAQDEHERKKEASIKAKLERKGFRVEDTHLLETAETAVRKAASKKKKMAGDADTKEWYVKSYEKNVRKLGVATVAETAKNAGVGRRAEKHSLEYGGRRGGETKEGVQRLADEIDVNDAKKRKKMASSDNADMHYINKKNEAFVKRITKKGGEWDEASREIRQNLERGTAL